MKTACALACLCMVAIAQAGAPAARWSVSRAGDGRQEIALRAEGTPNCSFRYDLETGQYVGIGMGSGVSMSWLPVAGIARLHDIQWSQGYPVIHWRSVGTSILECPQPNADGWVRSVRISAGQEPILIAVAELVPGVTLTEKSATWKSRDMAWRAGWVSAHPCRWLAREGHLALEISPRREATDVTISVIPGEPEVVGVVSHLPPDRIEAEASAAGIRLRFADSLATQVAADRDHWHIADVFDVAKSPALTKVNIGTDDRSVLLGLTGATPGSVMAIGYRLKTAEGLPFEGEILVRTED